MKTTYTANDKTIVQKHPVLASFVFIAIGLVTGYLATTWGGKQVDWSLVALMGAFSGYTGLFFFR